ncbi:MAG: Crp/Fnr family transcriptional regulator [Vicingaceae bacterium]|nr:Crp/Fnr family transcriptional regulator [Vicingaceae bacterium]
MPSFLKQYCSQEWIDFIEFHKSTITIPKNNIIFHKNDTVKGLYIIEQGKVKVFDIENTDKEKIFRLAGNGEILGHRGLGGDWKYPISAKTYEDSIFSFIPISIFNIVTKTNPEFTYHLMMFYAEELRNSETKINHLQVKNRIARAILYNKNVFGTSKNDASVIEFTIPRKDYASIANTTYESVIRTLKELSDEKIISTNGKSIQILNYEALNLLAK